MNLKIRDKFARLWKKYFDGAELPICFYYTEVIKGAEEVKKTPENRCVICALATVRKGKSLFFGLDSTGCPGGKRYLGFSEKIRPNFEYFLSCGIPGELEGERYKKSPELVKEVMQRMPVFKAPHKFIVFKRWDLLEESDNPEVVIFFAQPDVLSGLFTLASYDEVEPNGVICPFGSGCSAIVHYPYLEKKSEHPRGVIGMFDPSARPCLPADVITFATPMNKFYRMIENMEESFLITPTWGKVSKRISKVKEGK
jgi:uncharacterized protein (DUF169 family)